MKTFARLAIVALALSGPAGLAIVASAVVFCLASDLIVATIEGYAWAFKAIRSAC
jgi:hypothetical protein